jgi:hypothetical protein
MASIARQMALYRAKLARLGKPLPRVRPLIKEIYCAKDRRTALELARPYLGAKYRAYGRREFPVLPHALARRAPGPRAGQHAAHERRAPAGAAAGEGLTSHAFLGDQPYAVAQAPPISIARSLAVRRSVCRNGSTACS